jgi:regulator of sirC expression with transglutaminase-like and TPR domain
MRSLAATVRFSVWAASPPETQRLDEGALLIAEIGHPGLDHRPSIRQLDALAAEVWASLGPSTRLLRPRQLARRTSAQRVLEAINEALITRHGFHGAEEDYYHPRNSFLNEVLERREGLPITLSVIYLEVARRLGAPLEGVGLPAHFMARWPLPDVEGGSIYVDAFQRGELFDEPAMRQRILRLLRAPARADFDPEWTRPLDARQILTRMLRNLKQVYLMRGETASALETVDRLTALRPDLPEELRDRGLLRLAMGEPLLAAADIATYLEQIPNAPEGERLLRRIQSIREVRAKLN